jgi:hypothetical protein
MMGSASFGSVIPLQTLFLVDTAMLQVQEVALPNLRDLIGKCDACEESIFSAGTYLAAEQVGDIKLRGAKAGETHPDLLRREYRYWCTRLSEFLGVPMYTWSDVARGGGSGNIPVRG